MFKLVAFGKVYRHVEEGVLLHVSHHQEGNRDPVVVRCDRDRELVNRRSFPPGSSMWVEGDGYQVHEDGQFQLAINPSAVHSSPPRSTRYRMVGIWCMSAHVRVSTWVTCEKIDRGEKRGSVVTYFGGHVSVPEMEPGKNVVLRCRMEGGKADLLGQHRKGDWIVLEGELLEERFTDKPTGQRRRAHQLRVREFSSAAMRGTPRDVAAEGA